MTSESDAPSAVGPTPRGKPEAWSSAHTVVSGVPTLELFFDLVFVFTITQLTAVASPSGASISPNGTG